MTPFEQKLLSEVMEQGRLIRRLARLITAKEADEQMLTAEQVQQKYMPAKKISAVKKYLQVRRKNGTFKKFQTLAGKNYRYDESEIKKLFTEIHN